MREIEQHVLRQYVGEGTGTCRRCKLLEVAGSKALVTVTLQILIGIALLIPPTTSFVVPLHTHKPSHFRPTSTSVRHRYVALSPPTDASFAAPDSFHADLKKALKDYKFDMDPLQRRSKPKVLKGDVDGAEKAVRMLRHMVRIGVATEASFQMVFSALLRRGRMQWFVVSGGDGGREYTCAANELEILLTELEELVDADRYNRNNYDTDNVNVNVNGSGGDGSNRVSTATYNMVLESYANCANSRGNYRYAEKAEDLLGRMGSSSMDATSLLCVLRAWAWQQANRGDSKCARRAMDYALQLEQLSAVAKDDDKDTSEAILAEAYDLVVEAYSKAVGGAPQADAIFKKRVKLNVPTPMADYTNVILAWTKDTKEESIVRATSLVETMSELFLAGKLADDPEHIAFSSVISAWTQLDQPEKAEELLWLMEKDVRPMAKSFKPSVYTYNNVCHAYIKVNAKINNRSVNAVSRIVKYMEENWKEQPLIKPDSFTYNTLIKAWNMSGNLQTVEQIEQVLDRMEAVLEGGTVSNKNFNTVLNAYAKSKEESAVENALRLFERMKASKLVEPDTITYTTILECLSKCNRLDFAADKALEILHEIKSAYETTRKVSMMPNSRTFSMAILTITKSPDRIVQARELLDQLIALYHETKEPTLRPTAHAYNYVINCAANAISNRAQAFKIAAKTYQGLREDKELKPDSYTYAFWFKACNQLLKESNMELYEKFMTLSFAQCCKEGMVSREVLNRLRQGHLNYNQLSELLQCDAKQVMRIQVDDLELSWTRNSRRVPHQNQPL